MPVKSSATPFWAAAPKGPMTYALTHMGDFLFLLLLLLLLLLLIPSKMMYRIDLTI